jgi:hypothetical protein
MSEGSQGKTEVHRRLMTRLRQQAEDVRRLTAGLDDEKLSRRTMPSKWSLKELVCHLGRIQDVFDARVAAMVGQERPTIVSYEPEEDPDFEGLTRRPAAVCLQDFFSGRDRLYARLEALRPDQWHRPGRHAEYPDYDVHFAIEYMAHHEAHHIYQMYQRRAPLGPLPHH